MRMKEIMGVLLINVLTCMNAFNLVEYFESSVDLRIPRDTIIMGRKLQGLVTCVDALYKRVETNTFGNRKIFY